MKKKPIKKTPKPKKTTKKPPKHKSAKNGGRVFNFMMSYFHIRTYILMKLWNDFTCIFVQ